MVANEVVDKDDDDSDEEYDDDYDPEEEAYLNTFINKNSIVSNLVKWFKQVKQVRICFVHIFLCSNFAR